MSAFEIIRFGEVCEVQVFRVVHSHGTIVRTHIAQPLSSTSESNDDSGFGEIPPDHDIPEEVDNLLVETLVETSTPSDVPRSENILKMSLKQRKALLSDTRAGTVTILANNNEMIRIPLRVFQVMSSKASDIDFINNAAPVFRIPHALPNGPFAHIRDWLKNNLSTSVKMPFLPSAKTIKNNFDDNELKQDLSIIRTASSWAWSSTQIIYSDDVVISLDGLAAIESLALSEDDPFLRKVVKRLGWSIHRKAIPNAFTAYIDIPEHSRLRDAVNAEIKRIKDAESQHRAAKEAENREKYGTWKMNEERRRRRQVSLERKKKERKERNERAKEGAAKKRDQKIRVVTQDEKRYI